MHRSNSYRRCLRLSVRACDKKQSKKENGSEGKKINIISGFHPPWEKIRFSGAGDSDQIKNFYEEVWMTRGTSNRYWRKERRAAATIVHGHTSRNQLWHLYLPSSFLNLFHYSIRPLGASVSLHTPLEHK